MAQPAALECRSLTVSYGPTVALRSLDLRTEHGETLAILGPSGSGKTTLLYTVAGFIPPKSGEVRMDGRLVATPGDGLAPEDRNVAIIFQNYALWPHLTAVETVAYPLLRQGTRTDEARRQASELLDRMGILALADRRPAELSGGQQQRVGVARALARQARLYLFDEPTAHLDAALRADLQEELAERRRSTGAAALYATHDATEALAVAHRVALLRDGALVQQGSPAEIYEQPVDLWAARLTGPATVITASVDRTSNEKLVLSVGDESVTVQARNVPSQGGSAQVLVRPDWARLGGRLPAVVREVWYRGTHTDYRLETPAGQVDIREQGFPSARAGHRVTWDLRRVWVISGPP